ncbi:flagellar export protein FliJ [Paenibacillus sp. YPG26]|uniref:flagellar export protein FliJ n=1 Tax=Paenibacillus sp. YPG26 TaxID=2878915 RepID=UPI002040268C|nr:flagellar export protein FliJ [Paenibacillus sp. YPG26]USB32096.1 flagellar export protein FliJ [Paenibacillus sp. YPG26]
MKFKYMYQKVVDLKSNEKTQAEWMLSAAIGELQTEQLTLNKLIEDKTRATHAMLSEGASSMLRLQELQRYVEHLDRCIKNKLCDIKCAETNVEHKQSQLSTRMLDEKVWLKAKEKAKAGFEQQILLREQNELDEMATIRFAMKAQRV